MIPDATSSLTLFIAGVLLGDLGRNDKHVAEAMVIRPALASVEDGYLLLPEDLSMPPCSKNRATPQRRPARLLDSPLS